MDDMLGGWFVGDFTPAAHQMSACEVAIKRYAAGMREGEHHHRVATEITVVIEGDIEMMGQRWGCGDVIVIEPGEATGFHAVTAACCVVVKSPSVAGDKHPGSFEEHRQGVA